jgi:MATE family multidrug resistance protein
MPMVINMFAYWALGFPLAYMATITYRAPPSYIWAGFVLGLTVAAILLTFRFLRISKDQLSVEPSDAIRGSSR